MTTRTVAPGTAVERRLREKYVVDTKFNAGGFFEIWIGSTPNGKAEEIAVTRDETVYHRAMDYYRSDALIDAWIVPARIKGRSATATLSRIRLADRET